MRMKSRSKYYSPPLRPSQPEPTPELPGPWRAAARNWLDLVGNDDHILTSCDGWSGLMGIVLTGSLRPGKYRVDDGNGRRVAELVVDGSGLWRVYSPVPPRR